MGRFDRGGGGRGRSFGGPKRGFNNHGSRPTMFKTICSKCGKECEVPFRPSGEKPVFCRDCFRENGGPDARRSEERSFQRPSFDRPVAENRSAENPQLKEQLTALNVKLDKILAILHDATTPKETPAQEPTVEKKKRTTKKPLATQEK